MKHVLFKQNVHITHKHQQNNEKVFLTEGSLHKDNHDLKPF